MKNYYGVLYWLVAFLVLYLLWPILKWLLLLVVIFMIYIFFKISNKKDNVVENKSSNNKDIIDVKAKVKEKE